MGEKPQMTSRQGTGWRLTATFALAVLSLATIGDAQAGGAPTPGAVREDIRSTAPKPTAPAAPETESTARAAAPAVPAGGTAVLVQHFEVSGNTVLPPDQVRSLLAGYEGRKLTLAEIYGVADRLASEYRKAGYNFASVSVPAQKVAGGIVKLQVIEGRVGQVKFQGNRRYTNDFLKGQVSGIAPGQVLTTAAVEEQAIKLNELPGLRTRAVIDPGRDFGTSDVTFKSREKTFDFAARINNYGRPTIGQWRVEGDAHINNPLAFGDRIDLNIVHAEAGLLNYGRFGYDMPVGPWGTHANVYYSRFKYGVDNSALSAAFTGVDISGDGEDFGLGLTQPLRHTRTENWDAGLAFDRIITRQTTSIAGIAAPGTNNVNIGVMRLTSSYSRQYADESVSALSGEFSSNFRGYDPRSLGTRADNGGIPAKLRVDASYLRPLKYDFTLVVRGSGMVSARPLPDTEKYRLGGRDSIRAFDSAEIAGDEGIGGGVELRRPLNMIPSVPLEARLFVDAGMVHTKNLAAGVQSNESLSGAGVGLSAQLTKLLVFDIDVVQALSYDTRTVKPAYDEPRVWAGFSSTF